MKNSVFDYYIQTKKNKGTKHSKSKKHNTNFTYTRFERKNILNQSRVFPEELNSQIHPLHALV